MCIRDRHSTGFQCARELWSRLWCWCRSVLTALLSPTSPNCSLCFRSSASEVSFDGRTTYVFPEPEPWSAGTAWLSWDHLCGTVSLLLYGGQRRHCTLSSGNWRPICSTSDVLWTEGPFTTARRCCDVFLWFWHRIQNYRLAYLLPLNSPVQMVWTNFAVCQLTCQLTDRNLSSLK